MKKNEILTGTKEFLYINFYIKYLFSMYKTLLKHMGSSELEALTSRLGMKITDDINKDGTV